MFSDGAGYRPSGTLASASATKPAKLTRTCTSCHKPIPTRGGKKYCSGCYDVRLQAIVQAARERAKVKRQGMRCE